MVIILLQVSKTVMYKLLNKLGMLYLNQFGAACSILSSKLRHRRYMLTEKQENCCFDLHSRCACLYHLHKLQQKAAFTCKPTVKKICLLGAKLLHADRQTDVTNLAVHSCQF